VTRECDLDRGVQLRGGYRLDEIVEDRRACRLGHRLGVAVRGNGNDRHRPLLMDLLGGRQPVEVRHAHVEEHEIGTHRPCHRHGAGPIASDAYDGVAKGAKILLEAKCGDALIFPDEDAQGGSGHQELQE
jgi:hypothetical protein